MKELYANRLEDVINLLTEIKEKCGGHIPFQINLWNDRMLSLKSICLDNSEGNQQAILYLEGDYQDKEQYKDTFNFYTQGEDI